MRGFVVSGQHLSPRLTIPTQQNPSSLAGTHFHPRPATRSHADVERPLYIEAGRERARCLTGSAIKAAHQPWALPAARPVELASLPHSSAFLNPVEADKPTPATCPFTRGRH